MILGIWDGHDSGAALVENGTIIKAANEERFTRRKLEIRFPENSIKWLLEYGEPDTVAVPTYDFQKTLSRIAPFLQESYRRFRRRKGSRRFEAIKRMYKYWSTPIKGSFLSRMISEKILKSRLKKLGVGTKIQIIDHHESHAYTAIQSGFKKSLVITLDGLGDGKSGTISVWNGKELEKLHEISARNSIGVFFEQVTTILGFRELEDEGKVSALATYAIPEPWEKNPFKNFFEIKGTTAKSSYNPLSQFFRISDIAWSLPREQTAFFAQQAIEKWVSELVSNAVDETGIRNLSLAGGLFANVKLNRVLREYADRIFIFPHMGDGGLAAGAALAADGKQGKLESVYLGPSYEISKEELGNCSEIEKPWKEAANLILDGEIVFWFQGEMEYGPRALGHRSILERPDYPGIRDRLNLKIKKRQWFQPFCPSVLEEDSELIFEDGKRKDKFMTMAYKIKDGMKRKMSQVIAPDLTSRPQMVGKENPDYRKLLREVKKETGIGAVLNTSFNLHGEPIVMTPADALKAFKKAGDGYLIIGSCMVEP